MSLASRPGNHICQRTAGGRRLVNSAAGKLLAQALQQGIHPGLEQVALRGKQLLLLGIEDVDVDARANAVANLAELRTHLV